MQDASGCLNCFECELAGQERGVEIVSDTLVERIRELREREPILSTTGKAVAIDLLTERVEALEDAVLMLDEAFRALAKPQKHSDN
jgi:hypothetical protein